MTSPSERAMKLMAYADGELEGDELAEVEAWLAEDAGSVQLANELAHLGDLVRVGHAASTDAKAVLSFDVADAVMAKLNAAPTTNVSSLEARRAARTAGATRPLKVAAAAVAALALAAAVFVMARTKDEQPMARSPAVAPASPAFPAAAASVGGVDVETSSGSVSVFYFSDETAKSPSVVVWVDEGAKQ